LQQDFPESHPVEGERNPEGLMIAGGSIIINPLGETLAGPLRGEEGCAGSSKAFEQSTDM
jgi:beta-cyano-L-alanine hydratase/nitrilase